MKVAVAGLWHLGTVTAACLAAAGHWVAGFDDQEETIEQLHCGHLPVEEPGLAQITAKGLESGRLRFTSVADDLNDCEVVWFTHDTPVDDDDRADVDFVVAKVKHVL